MSDPLLPELRANMAARQTTGVEGIALLIERASNPVHGLSAVSSQLLRERAKVKEALARIAKLRELNRTTYYGDNASDCIRELEAILRRSGDPGTDQDGGR